MTLDLHSLSPEYVGFWRERHIATLSTQRPDGGPHLVPVGVTFDDRTRIARVIANRHSKKVRNLLAAHAAPAGTGPRAAVCQVEQRRWATLEGTARVRTEPEAVADAERRYAERYGRVPRPNPDRVVIEIAVDRALGRA
jgi:F420H(2)-dependent biliverdin reductase